MYYHYKNKLLINNKKEEGWGKFGQVIEQNIKGEIFIED